MRLNSYSTLYKLIAALTMVSAFGQIRQDRPELCGKPDFVTVPTNVQTDKNDLVVTLRDTQVSIRIPIHGTVEQVCPIAATLLQPSRYLVFVQAPSRGSREILVLEANTGALLDRFRTYNAVVSPDQNWIAYQAFSPPSPEYSDQYYLYDLSEAPDAKFRDSEGSIKAGTKGRLVYPVVEGGGPPDEIGLSDDHKHQAAGIFVWSSDSHALVFADLHNGRTSIVLVRLKPAGPEATVYPLINGTVVSAVLIPQSQLVLVHLKNESSREEEIKLRYPDFTPAPIEVHPISRPKLETILVPSKEVAAR